MRPFITRCCGDGRTVLFVALYPPPAEDIGAALVVKDSGGQKHGLGRAEPGIGY